MWEITSKREVSTEVISPWPLKADPPTKWTPSHHAVHVAVRAIPGDGYGEYHFIFR